jgi:hypothetical protein
MKGKTVLRIQIKRDEISKDTKNHLKFRKKIRKMLMQRSENREDTCSINSKIEGFSVFDPLLDWEFRPICGCELIGMEKRYYNIKHNNLFGKKGHRLIKEEYSSSENDDLNASEGFELWVLDDLSLVFTYYCTAEIPDTSCKMIYRYPLGKKIPEDMTLDEYTFLSNLSDEIYSLRNQ